MTYTYNVPLYSQTSYVQEYNVGSGYTMINPYDGYNEYRYRSRMVYECLYRVGEYDGYRYYYRYDPTIDARFYECYNITTGMVYAFNLQTGNWDVIYTPVPVVPTTNSYTVEKSTMDDCDRLVFEWNNLKRSRDFSSEKGIATVRNLFTEMKERFPGYVGDLLETETKIPEPETTSTSYHVDFGYVPEGFDTQSVQEAVQNIQPQPTPLSSSGAPCYTTFDGKYIVPEYVDPQPMPQKINSPEYAEYNKAIDELASMSITSFMNSNNDSMYHYENGYPVYGIDGKLIYTVRIYPNSGNDIKINDSTNDSYNYGRERFIGFYRPYGSPPDWKYYIICSGEQFENRKLLFKASTDKDGNPIALYELPLSYDMINALNKLGINKF